jgi:hypothetical protein
MLRIDIIQDDTGGAIVDRLQRELGLPDSAAVFKKALQLLNTVMASEDRCMIVRLDGQLLRVSLT